MNSKFRGMALVLSILFLFSSIIYISSQINPLSHQIVTIGEPINFNLALPGKLLKRLEINVTEIDQKKNYYHKLDIHEPVLNKTGHFDVKMKLFGFIPVRQMVISVVKPVKVLPGGQSIGIMINSEGVIVAGLCAVIDKNGKEHNPALQAGIKAGDIILKINGNKVKSDLHARELIAEAGWANKEAVFHVKRGERIIIIKVSPVLCTDTGRYRVGLYIRDGTAGVGTLTFYEPESMIYGALGHVIADMETSRDINLNDGCIVGAMVQAVHPGKRGQPGEKIGLFQSEKDIKGSIEKNTAYGIFGHLKCKMYNPFYPEPIPVAMGSQVNEGPAEILTVLKAERIEKFNIEIQKVNTRIKTNGKDLIIKINDDALLNKTGGIIQGMSGSPIIQNGKLVGAVTHVFINDPQRGYGILAERMLKEAGIFSESKDKIPGMVKPGIFFNK